MTGGLMHPSEGFLYKLYKRASGNLEGFLKELKGIIVSISYYTAHEHKGLDSLLDDRVLAMLTPQTIAMHDYNRVNYNEHFCFSEH